MATIFAWDSSSQPSPPPPQYIWNPFVPKSRQRQLVPTPDWLSARYLLRSLDNNIIEQCYNEIIESVDNKQDIIYMLIKSSTSDQLKNIIEILKNAQSKVINDNNYQIMHENKNEDDDISKSYFDYLPTESVHNICEFLAKPDMMTFKMVSASIALIIFDIMKCYKIGVFDMNELIEKNEYKFEANLDIFDTLKINRVRPFTKYKLLMDIYCKTYDISFENMLLLRSNNKNKLQRPQYTMDINSFCNGRILKNTLEFEGKIEKNRALFIFDKTKILSLNNTTKPTILSDCNDDHYQKHYDLTLLRYFNTNSQQIQNIQFLLLDKTTINTRIEEYITNDLKSIISNSYKNQSISWCDTLSSTLHKMKQFGAHSDHQLINIYNTKIGANNNITYTKYKSIPEIMSNACSVSIDEHFWQKDTFMVYQEDDVIFNAMLDDPNNNFFCKLQVLKDKLSEKYSFYCRDGRIGYLGEIDYIQYSVKQECIQKFKTRFFEMTRNRWEDRNSFKPQKGYYTYLIMDHSINAVHGDFRVITFEINSNHPGYIDANKVILTCSNPIYSNLQQFTMDQAAKYPLCIINTDDNFVEQIKYFNLESENEWSLLNIELIVSPMTTYTMLQNKISLALNNKIAANNIQIYKDIETKTQWGWNTSGGKISEKKILFGNKEIGEFVDNQHLKWMVVPYDTLSGDDDVKMYKICIYQETLNEKDIIKSQQQNDNNDNNDNHDESEQLLVATMAFDDEDDDINNAFNPHSFNEKNTITSQLQNDQLLPITMKFDDDEKEQQDNDSNDKHNESESILPATMAFDDEDDDRNKFTVSTTNKQTLSKWFQDEQRLDLFGFPENEILQFYMRYQHKEILPANDSNMKSKDDGMQEMDTKDNDDDNNMFVWNFEAKQDDDNNNNNNDNNNNMFMPRIDDNDANQQSIEKHFNWNNDISYRPKIPSPKVMSKEQEQEEKTKDDGGIESWSVHLPSSSKRTDETEQKMGTRAYEFEIYRESDKRRLFFYQNICIGNNDYYLNKSVDELRFEDEYNKIAASGHDAQIPSQIRQKFAIKQRNNNNNNNKWSFGEAIKNTKWSWDDDDDDDNNNKKQRNNDDSGRKVKIDEFIQNMIDIISHPMYGDKYKLLVDKYKNKEKYSFIITDNIQQNIGFNCYDNDDIFIQYPSISDIYKTNIVIVENVRNVLNDNTLNESECFPLIVRLCNNGEFTFGAPHAGYPKKVWVTKETTVCQVIKLYDIRKFKFVSCSSKNGELAINDNIYEKTRGQSCELFIYLEPMFKIFG